MMSWDYAELSHMAKEAGGPDLLLSTLESAARGQGRIEGAGIGALVAGAVLTGGALIYNQYTKRKQLAADAKTALVTGINEYDAEHSDAKTMGGRAQETDSQVEPDGQSVEASQDQTEQASSKEEE